LLGALIISQSDERIAWLFAAQSKKGQSSPVLRKNIAIEAAHQVRQAAQIGHGFTLPSD